MFSRRLAFNSSQFLNQGCSPALAATQTFESWMATNLFAARVISNEGRCYAMKLGEIALDLDEIAVEIRESALELKEFALEIAVELKEIEMAWDLNKIASKLMKWLWNLIGIALGLKKIAWEFQEIVVNCFGI